MVTQNPMINIPHSGQRTGGAAGANNAPPVCWCWKCCCCCAAVGAAVGAGARIIRRETLNQEKQKHPQSKNHFQMATNPSLNLLGFCSFANPYLFLCRGNLKA